MGTVGMANLAFEGDPRRPSVVEVNGQEIPVGAGTAFSTATRLHDPNVSFEEYLYHARATRCDDRYEELNPDYRLFGIKLKSNSKKGVSSGEHLKEIMAAGSEPGVNGHNGMTLAEKNGEKPMGTNGETDSGNGSKERGATYVTETEWTQASRALRTAGWSSVFFLITTDILGPFNVPTAFAYMGYGPGVVLYTIFGFLAGYSGFLLWKMFMGLDSDRYPMRGYGDIAYRIYGTWARHITSFFQFFQLFINVGIIIIQSGLSLEQVVTGSGANSVCFIILCFVWAIAGMLIGQIRTLKNIGWIANLSVWLNLFVIFMVMGVAANSGVLVDAGVAVNGPVLGTTADQPIMTSAGPPAGTGFYVQVNGLGLAVFAYGGATIFIELMAEMRKPFDFWKGMICAQLFIYFFYMLFGLFVYSYQGQFTINPAYQSIVPYAWQTTGNAIEIVTGLIAALLYGNIGLKVAYNNIGMDIFGAPSLDKRMGKILWVVFIPIFWGAAFVIGAAIPQITNLSGFVASAFIIQFSYTLPPFFYLGYSIKKDAMLPGDGFNPYTGAVVRADSGMKRMMRGFMKRPMHNAWLVLFTLGSLVTSALGIYAAIEGMIAAYAAGVAVSFTCNNPYNTSG